MRGFVIRRTRPGDYVSQDDGTHPTGFTADLAGAKPYPSTLHAALVMQSSRFDREPIELVDLFSKLS